MNERFAGYILSLPERVLRSAAALGAGLVRELGKLVLPHGIRRTRLYRSLVDDTLRFLIENVGDVQDAYPPKGALADNFAMRRLAGNGIEAIGLLTFRASPVWVLAALADLSGAGRQLVHEIGAALKEQGLLERTPDYESCRPDSGWPRAHCRTIGRRDQYAAAGYRRAAGGMAAFARAGSHDSRSADAVDGRSLAELAGPEGYRRIAEAVGLRGFLVNSVRGGGEVAGKGAVAVAMRRVGDAPYRRAVRGRPAGALSRDYGRDRPDRLRGILGKRISPLPAGGRRPVRSGPRYGDRGTARKNAPPAVSRTRSLERGNPRRAAARKS